MRQTLCPRCDNLLSKTGNCSICGYQVKKACHHCGHYNVPTAKYCGGCGKGTTVAIRYRRLYNAFFNPMQQVRLKRFFTGIAFGTLLGLFAFSSMGMKYYTPEELQSNEENLIETYVDENVTNSSILKSVTADLENFSQHNNNEEASFKDLNNIVNILTRNLNHIATRTNKTKRPLDSAEAYLEQEKSIKASAMATRGNSAQLLFAYTSDLLELQYKNYTKGAGYNDIPRFNMMDAPALALKSHNINLSATDNHFGVNESISVTELCSAAKQIATLAVQRANEKAPDLSAPPSIIID